MIVTFFFHACYNKHYEKRKKEISLMKNNEINLINKKN